MSTTYEIGYKKPPKAHQFKPGKSGNPKGRPRKIPQSFKEALSKALWMDVSIHNGSKKEKVTYAELIARTLVSAAVKDIKAAKFLSSLTHGFDVPMPSERGMIFFHPKQMKIMDLLEHAFTVWGKEYEQESSPELAGASAPEATDQSGKM